MSLTEAMQAIGRPVETACKLIENLLGQPFHVAGGALSDQVRVWQWQNRLRIADRVNKTLEERSIACRQLAPDFLLPFIEACGNASDDSVQETWARLLVSAIDDAANEHIAFVNILKSMNGLDVRVLRAMIDLGYFEPRNRVEAISDHLDVSADHVRLSIANLDHMGFFTPTQKRLKSFAIQFIKACIGSDDALDRYLAQQKEVSSNVIFD